MKVSSEMVQNMHREAEKVCVPELVRLMKESKDPFLNFIYDSDPLERIFWDNVVLVGDAAHPTTPHASSSTNMSILDVAVLGKLVANLCDAQKNWEKWSRTYLFIYKINS